MSHIMVQAQLERTTHLPEDRVVNSFHFSTAATPALSADWEACLDAVQAFYDTPGAGAAASVMNVYSVVLTGTVALAAYDMSDPLPRVPVATRTFTEALDVGIDPLPSEVALCLSYRGDLSPGDDPRNYRGRVYLGPFSTGDDAGGVIAGDSRPASSLMDVFVRAAATHLMAPADPRWCVFSRDLTLLVPITHVWVDDAWDTQRRRGAKATTRQTADR